MAKPVARQLQSSTHSIRLLICIFTIFLSSAGFLLAQAPAAPDLDPSLFAGMKYRLVGPFRGGRSAAVTGVPSKPMLYYFGSTGGGVWRTTDGGATWANISDGFFGGSIGAVAVADSDSNVIYVGSGEKTVRGNVSHGNGIWKSQDAGKSWKHMGLADTRHIPRIRIHPKNPDLVYVAALGHLYGPNNERGVYRSNDGGATWKRILFVNEQAGAVDLILDPGNPRVLYASTWRVLRTPYSLESGGPGSGLWKSTDGGDTWQEISRNKGLPAGVLGIIGVAVSPVDSERVWAIIEATDGGVFRSDDAGKTWTRTSEDRNLRQRAWYYTRIYAGPTNKEEVYVLNVGMMHSTDGGSTFRSIRTPHGDHHDLWIDPVDGSRMIVGDDGGAQVSTTGGASWTPYNNQPTAQFYRVVTDNHFPFRIYGAQQDNSTVRISSRGSGFGIGESDWEPTAGGESGHIAPDPKDNDVVYGGSYGGYLTRINHRTGESRGVNVWPDNPIGHGAADLKYRFQWNYPIFFSPHDPNTLYTAAQVLFKSTSEGQQWQAISPDLTRNDKSKQGPSGGPITKDNTSVEYYCTIFAALESSLEKGALWCGSDDGLVHVSRDAGKTWLNVTPKDLPEWAMVNSLEAHPTQKGGLYLAATRYKLDDFQPYLYKTTDYGKTWTKIVAGIPKDHFTRVVRADPKRSGLLYAGTENGMYISMNDGTSWQPFQLNLPIVPITDLTLKNDDLVVATQGRSFWVLDDLTRLHQLRPQIKDETVHLFQPRTAYRLPGGGFASGEDSPPSRTQGDNPPSGIVLECYLKEAPAKEAAISLEILAQDKVIRSFGPKAELPANKWEPKAGMNRVVWDLRHPGPESFPGMVLWGGLTSPRAIPGKYQARLRVGDNTKHVKFEVKPDPRVKATPADYEAQFRFLLSASDKLTEMHKSIIRIRDIRGQLGNLKSRIKDQPRYKDVIAEVDRFEAKLTKVEEALYQTKAQSSQDVLNYPIRLNNRLSSLAGTVATGDNRPTDQAEQLKSELFAMIDQELAKLKMILEKDLPEFNRMLNDAKVPGVFAEPVGKGSGK